MQTFEVHFLVCIMEKDTLQMIKYMHRFNALGLAHYLVKIYKYIHIANVMIICVGSVFSSFTCVIFDIPSTVLKNSRKL